MPPRSMNYLIQALGKILLEAVKNEIAKPTKWSNCSGCESKLGILWQGEQNGFFY